MIKKDRDKANKHIRDIIEKHNLNLNLGVNLGVNK